jgi:hypothetical protein
MQFAQEPVPANKPVDVAQIAPDDSAVAGSFRAEKITNPEFG